MQYKLCNSSTMCMAAHIIMKPENKCIYSLIPAYIFYLILFSTCLFHRPFSCPTAGETTSIQEADQSCAIMLKSMPSLSLGHGEGDHLISSSPLSVHPLLAQPGDELGRLFVCCPPDVACPWRGCSFFSLLLQYLIYFQYSQKRRHCWTCEDTDRLAR